MKQAFACRSEDDGRTWSDPVNLDTPGFIRSDVNFEEALALALERGLHAPHRASDLLAGLSVRPQPDRTSPARADGNNVRSERELILMTTNRLRFDMAIQWAQSRLQTLRSAIVEGRR